MKDEKKTEQRVRSMGRGKKDHDDGKKVKREKNAVKREISMERGEKGPRRGK